ncbi:hypothetical protein CcaverHIS002_0700290 [Cutaneotrichosporon cavernicola]|uniref:RNA-directed DNA polymerase n=1 Tax=Cutaneotrichosporon cavernicola TaxID=279322 RepID=A0AA48QYF1_9TREE|nr:uncharacterized protein CcaverHIS019_0700290 [Cutaneotrichosporon cavernicola]BEI86683.1 hypothetical protein CcaverHIS002_0700290 [Cutaneotrichosporon cavernicola]BEI94457.1 hypothetical protein CcaverHIS019_0700290 [Cutaneotrichosporon cavernicola]BEJ02234.1 hypothetical protein CcaverHIS631_0700290 [Cutaneotrichosporon cavernicola]BEJ09993.1 hypothetical protein CcaverHIS641_0700280 [Cutaneotrichosporon cavernicola]
MSERDMTPGDSARQRLVDPDPHTPADENVLVPRSELDDLRAQIAELKSRRGSRNGSRHPSSRHDSRPPSSSHVSRPRRPDMDAWRREDEERARRHREENERVAESCRQYGRTASPRHPSPRQAPYLTPPLTPPTDDPYKPRHRFTLKPGDFPKFSATTDTNIDDWITTVSMILDQTGVADFEITSRLPLVLTGAASKWFIGLSPEERRNLRTWSQWCDRLRTAFRPADYDLVLRDRARNRVLLPSENVSDYFYDKVRLLRTAYPTNSDREHVYDVLLGLPQRFRALCHIDTDVPIDQLHRNLVEYAVLLPRGYTNGVAPPVAAHARTSHHVGTTVAATKPAPASGGTPALSAPPPAPPGAPKPPAARAPQRPCRYCGGSHWDRECPNPKKDANVSRPATNTNTTPLGPRREAFFSDVATDGTVVITTEASVNAATPNQRYKYTPCYTAISVSNKPHRAIIDPGSGISMVAKEYVTFHMPSTPLQPCSSFPVRGVGSSATVFGFVTVPVTFPATPPFTVNVDFYATTDAPAGLLLGNDCLGRLGAVVDLGRSQLTVHGNVFPLSYLAPAARAPFSAEHAQAIRTRESFNVTVEEDVVIRPGHRARVAMKTSEHADSPFLITPVPMHGNAGLPCQTPHAVADSSSFTGELVNLHHQPVHIRPGDAVGTASLIHTPTSTCVVETSSPSDPDQIDVNPDLTAEQRHAVDDMLRHRMHAFSSNNSVGRTNVVEFNVDTGEHLPISQPPYHASPRQRVAIDAAIDGLLAAGHASPSHSPWASPVLVVQQHDKKRMCVDYRRLNKVTKSDQYPLPRIDDILSQFQGKMWFSTLDANRGYHQVPVADADKKKLAFRTHRGLFEPTVMPFGAKGVPATFQRMMDVILAAGKWQWCLAYLDDVIIYSKTFEQHVDNVAWTLDAIAAAGLTLGAGKSHLFYQSLDCLGHTVSALGIGIIGRNVDAILKQEPPKTLAALECFSGLAGHYRRFIEKFSLVARPIHDKINTSRKTKAYDLDDATLTAFHVIKNLVAERPLLAHPDYSLGFRVESDACRDGFGAILSQKGADGIVRPIVFLSRVTTAPEKNYSATELECTALTWALRRFHPYIDGAELEAITDHAALQWLLDYTGPNQRLVRQSLALQPYRDKLTIRHRPGKNHAHVDQLSRAPLPITTSDFAVAMADEPVTSSPADSAAAFLAWAAPDDPSLIKAVKEATPQDAKLAKIIAECIAHAANNVATEPAAVPDATTPVATEPAAVPAATTPLPHPRLPFTTQDGLAFVHRPSLGAYALCIPTACDEIRDKILFDYHDTPVSGHRSADKTFLAIAPYYHWPGMRRFITKYVQTCDACQKHKPAIATTSPMQPLAIPTTRWHTVTMDFAVDLPVSNAFNAIMVVVDKFTKRCHLIPTLTTATAKDTAFLFLANIVRLHGIPVRIVSDRDPKFTSAFWKAIHAALGTKLLLSTAFHPQTDGQSERQVRTLKEALRHFVNARQNNWFYLLLLLEIAFNSSVHSSSNVTPFELDLGFHPRFLNHPASVAHDDKDASVFIDALNAATVDAVESLQHAQARQAGQYDARNVNRRQTEYKVGDQVLLRSSLFKPVFYQKSKSKQLAPTWFGPFTVTSVDGPTVITVDLPLNLNIHNRVNTMNARKYLARVKAHPSAVREVEQILGHRTSIRTNAFPDGKPQWLVRFKNAPTGAEQWLDHAELVYYGGDAIINPSSGEDALNPSAGAPAALGPQTALSRDITESRDAIQSATLPRTDL